MTDTDAETIAMLKEQLRVADRLLSLPHAPEFYGR
jgi:hypothetical protein